MSRNVFTATTCPTCCRPAGSPFRAYSADGKVANGCVDHFHAGRLVTPSTSARWHGRPEAKRIRAAQKLARGGCVTVPA